MLKPIRKVPFFLYYLKPLILFADSNDLLCTVVLTTQLAVAQEVLDRLPIDL
jgi:hypothetical protein